MSPKTNMRAIIKTKPSSAGHIFTPPGLLRYQGP
jgi:hypothetical protein